MDCDNKCCCLEDEVDAKLEVKEWRPLRYIDMVEKRYVLYTKCSEKSFGNRFNFGYLSHELIRFFRFSPPPQNKLVYARY